MENTKINYWTFFANPKQWYIDDFLNSDKCNDEVYYKIRPCDRKNIDIGDKGLIRVGIDHRTKKSLRGKEKLKPGIYAIIEVVSKPEYIKDSDLEFYDGDYENSGDKEMWRIKFKIIKNLIDSPIIFNEIENEVLSRDKYLVKGFQASTMPLIKESFYEAINIINSTKNRFSYEEVINDDDYDFGCSKSSIEGLNEIYKNVDIKKKERLVKIVERGSIANKFKAYMGYKCQICDALNENPHTFKKKDGKYYVEVHHIIPVSYEEESKLSVDNLICLCPNHHRQMHYGNVEILSNNDLYTEYKIDGNMIKIEKVKFEID
ncbi:EVE domain-containing protein [Romboutsia sp. CE17]|uniref:EVE domain-containing protein n=1 Tax=Romboutsia sp. CE17 TaxID=2724150 RepID=UPI001442DE88|nr:EVE domain-containing protein [Romboutsia sp. CE17]QJA09085.1 EVE domain-containing protein [Romboutsia sp. CE17]